MAYSFRKMFFIGQTLKHVHMTYSFLELLIFFWLFSVWSLFLATPKKHCMWIQTSRETSHEVKANIFTCFLYWFWIFRGVTTGGVGGTSSPTPNNFVVTRRSSIFMLRRVSLFVLTSFLALNFHNRVYY